MADARALALVVADPKSTAPALAKIGSLGEVRVLPTVLFSDRVIRALEDVPPFGHLLIFEETEPASRTNLMLITSDWQVVPFVLSDANSPVLNARHAHRLGQFGELKIVDQDGRAFSANLQSHSVSPIFAQDDPTFAAHAPIVASAVVTLESGGTLISGTKAGQVPFSWGVVAGDPNDTIIEFPEKMLTDLPRAIAQGDRILVDDRVMAGTSGGGTASYLPIRASQPQKKFLRHEAVRVGASILVDTGKSFALLELAGGKVAASPFLDSSGTESASSLGAGSYFDGANIVHTKLVDERIAVAHKLQISYDAKKTLRVARVFGSLSGFTIPRSIAIDAEKLFIAEINPSTGVVEQSSATSASGLLTDAGNDLGAAKSGASLYQLSDKIFALKKFGQTGLVEVQSGGTIRTVDANLGQIAHHASGAISPAGKLLFFTGDALELTRGKVFDADSDTVVDVGLPRLPLIAGESGCESKLLFAFPAGDEKPPLTVHAVCGGTFLSRFADWDLAGYATDLRVKLPWTAEDWGGALGRPSWGSDVDGKLILRAPGRDLAVVIDLATRAIVATVKLSDFVTQGLFEFAYEIDRGEGATYVAEAWNARSAFVAGHAKGDPIAYFVNLEFRTSRVVDALEGVDVRCAGVLRNGRLVVSGVRKSDERVVRATFELNGDLIELDDSSPYLVIDISLLGD